MPVKRSHEEIAVILDEIQDKERRKHNVVIHNLRETEGQTHEERTKGDDEKFKIMVKDGMKLVVQTTKTFRVGKKDDNKPRLMVVTLTNMADKMEILKLAASLRDTEWSRVYVTPDLTWKEREEGRQLRSELARRKEAGEEHIWIRRGRIVPIPVEKQQLHGPRNQPRQPGAMHQDPGDPDRQVATQEGDTDNTRHNTEHNADMQPHRGSAEGAGFEGARGADFTGPAPVNNAGAEQPQRDGDGAGNMGAEGAPVTGTNEPPAVPEEREVAQVAVDTGNRQN